ncbi:zinc-dependent metalloprotease [Galbibacter mesophilus]|uniref:zinc-dependent metalloprotease n=1 Tax=Galbibacter mesophilus TaxID=379069 RepID=UPI00191F5A1E|nr:zinc-dependent metalloprotease [Galbibacter mesophilus]MCM5663657.1 zinc-dependent metalloprotease [Galbibacter mesophilus]
MKVINKHSKETAAMKMGVYMLAFMVLFPFVGHGRNVTKEFNSFRRAARPFGDKGFIKAKLEGKQLYLGIPKHLMGTPMLFIKNAHDNFVYYRQVEWQQVDDRLYLVMPRVYSTAGVTIPVDGDSYVDKKIIGVFPIEVSKSSEDLFWINATDLFFDKILTPWEKGGNDPVLVEHSSIVGVRFLENELLVETGQLKSNKEMSWEEKVDYNFYLLPPPMESRAFDHRMGFDHDTKTRKGFLGPKGDHLAANITRWRLEKKQKELSVSEPIKPITFVIPSDIPKKWVPYIKKGILDWLPAFEAARFKNAIVVKIASADDSELEMNSLHNSKIIWGNHRKVRGFENVHSGTVSQVIDIRTGEILKANIIISSTVQSLVENYFVKCAPNDGRALEFPYSEELAGELLRELVSHETGHAFGLLDGNYGEYAYPFEKMRDIDWLQEMGHTPSVMTYARENYIVQPEDSIPPELLIQKVGPADIYSIRWGYRPFSGISREAEKDSLESIIREQDTVPWYRFHTSAFEIIGPGSTNEVVENRDPIASTELGLKNLERVVQLFPKVNETQKNYGKMERLYEKVLKHWYKQMERVLSLVGGYEVHYKSGSQSGDIYVPIPAGEQDRGLNYFVTHTFSPPSWLINPKALGKVGYSIYPDPLLEYQEKLLFEALRAQRFKRLEYMDKNLGIEVSAEWLLQELQWELFRELKESYVSIGARKQELQRKYVETLLGIATLKGNQTNDMANVGYSNSTKSLFMKSLMSLRMELQQCLEKPMDQVTYGHINILLFHLRELN